MRLSDAAITSFQKLYKDKCGIKLDYDEANVKALEELKRFSLIYKPIPKNDHDYFMKLKNSSK